MSHQTKKGPANFRSTTAQVISAKARFAPADTDLNFAYFHSMDIWQKTEIDLRRQIKKIKFLEKLNKS